MAKVWMTLLIVALAGLDQADAGKKKGKSGKSKGEDGGTGQAQADGDAEDGPSTSGRPPLPEIGKPDAPGACWPVASNTVSLPQSHVHPIAVLIGDRMGITYLNDTVKNFSNVHFTTPHYNVTFRDFFIQGRTDVGITESTKKVHLVVKMDLRMHAFMDAVGVDSSITNVHNDVWLFPDQDEVFLYDAIFDPSGRTDVPAARQPIGELMVHYDSTRGVLQYIEDRTVMHMKIQEVLVDAVCSTIKRACVQSEQMVKSGKQTGPAYEYVVTSECVLIQEHLV